MTRSALPQRSRTAFVALLVVPALVLSACGADGDKKPTAKPSVDLPTGNVEVPDGVTLTKAGEELSFGETATVAYEPNTARSSVIDLTVDSVQTGRISDLAAYQLNDQAKSRPYYVRVRVKNVGTGDLSRAPIPLYAQDTRNTLYRPSSFNNAPFRRCPSTALPAGFGPGKSMSGCLVYLVPPGGSLVLMSFRPLQKFEPITWKGAITPVVTKKQEKPKKKKKAQP